MRKLASHYILCGELFRFHCLAIDAEQFSSIYPLEQEEAGVAFYNGLLWVLPASLPAKELPWHTWQKSTPAIPLKEKIQTLDIGYPVQPDDTIMVWHFPDLTLSASEFSADNSRGNTYIQRL
ncbi:MAG: hypothetical protein LIP01_15260 [Tannerellaceae bacterium]|nr:hypothetical protein [Tannerellaceae bacterium]